MLNKDKVCTVEGCTSPVRAKGVCDKHYSALKVARNAKPCTCGCGETTSYGYVKGHKPRAEYRPTKKAQHAPGTMLGFSREYLSDVFEYSIVSGKVYRKLARAHQAAGLEVGTVDGKGYLHVSFEGHFLLLHRLAVFLTTGEIPVQVDHQNRNRKCNGWHNLRPCGAKSNAGNSGIAKHNTSGLRGVSLNARSGKWHAQIKINGKQTYLGRSECPITAARLYDAAARKHFGEFAHVNGV